MAQYESNYNGSQIDTAVLKITNASSNLAHLGCGIGTCSTAAATAAKVVTLSNYELVINGIVTVTFTNDVPANATLNINNKGAKSIYYKGSAIKSGLIKADDTVIFIYNGSQYVVISNSGSLSGNLFETLNITLTQVNGSNSAIIGASISIYEYDTNTPIASFTWEGSTIPCLVSGGTQYVVEVGGISRYIRPNRAVYIATPQIVRNITLLYRYAVVDFGLPSGTLWSAYNIGATTETGIGYYFSYGNIEGSLLNGVNPYVNAFSWEKYVTTLGYTLGSNTFSSGDSTYDAARAIWKADWRIPTRAELLELLDNTNITIINNYNNSGINVWKLAKKTNSSIFIVFPLSGQYRSNTSSEGKYLHHYNEYTWVSSNGKDSYGWVNLRLGGSKADLGGFGGEAGNGNGNIIRPVI